jgi:hypothetical protein
VVVRAEGCIIVLSALSLECIVWSKLSKVDKGTQLVVDCAGCAHTAGAAMTCGCISGRATVLAVPILQARP